VKRTTIWARALRPVPVLTALGVALGGCAVDGRPSSRLYGGGYYGSPYYGGPGYYGSPFYGGYAPYDRYYGPRGYYGGGGRGFGGGGGGGNWTQDRLRQHWIDQARRPR
jgi:hypothetical protein